MRASIPLLILAALLAAEEPVTEIRIASGGGSTPARPYGSGVFGWVGEKRLLEEEFAKDGITVSWHVIKGFGPGVNEAFANRSIDFALYGDFPAIIGRSAGIRVTGLLNTSRASNAYLVVPVGSSVTSIAQLAGKRVSVHKGRPFELAFDKLLEENGLTQGDLRIFNLPPNDGQQALASNRVDAFFGSDGYLLETKGLGKIIWSTRSKDPHLQSTADLFGREQFVTDHPEITRRLVRVFVGAYHRFSLEENREEFYQVLVNGGQIREVVEREWADVDLRQRNSPLIDPYIIEHYRRSSEYAKRRSMIRSAVPDLESWFQPSFADAALAELKLGDFWQPMPADGPVAAAAP